MKLSRTVSALAVAAALSASSASAAVVISILEVGADVNINVSGSLDITGATFLTSATAYGPGVVSGGANWYIAPGPGNPNDRYELSSADVPFGTSTVFFSSITSSGDAFFIWGNTGGTPVFAVPSGYTSGTALSASMNIVSTTLADMGFTPGSYGFGIPNDTITLNIGPVTSVPVPASLPLMLAGVAGFAALRRKKA